MPGEGRRRERIGALLVGVRDDDGALRYAGRVGTGFTEAELDGWPGCSRRSRATTRRSTAGRGRPAEARLRRAGAASAEVEFTRVDAARACCARPSYKGLRDDKPARCWSTREPVAKRKDAASSVEVDGRERRLSNLDKVLYPKTGFTKGDLIDYYVRDRAGRCCRTSRAGR